MNQLRAWLYGRDVRNRWPNQEDTPQQDSLAGSPVIASDVNEPSEDDGEHSHIRRLLLKYVPLQTGDCLGCKLVGTTVMAVSGLIVLTSAAVGRERNPNLLGRKLVIYKLVCGSLFVGFEAAAICRFFDLGPFAKVAEYNTTRQRRM